MHVNDTILYQQLKKGR